MDSCSLCTTWQSCMMDGDDNGSSTDEFIGEVSSDRDDDDDDDSVF